VDGIIVPEHNAERYGLHTTHIKRKKDLGGGIIARVEGMHLLHCVVSSI
jgi:hypothetical protein